MAARTWTRPESLTRVSNAGCLAVAGPCSTAPSLSLKVDPCHGQVTQAAPPTLVDPPLVQRPAEVRAVVGEHLDRVAVGAPRARPGNQAGGGPAAPPAVPPAGTGRASRARRGARWARHGSPRRRAAARGGRPGRRPPWRWRGRRLTAGSLRRAARPPGPAASPRTAPSRRPARWRAPARPAAGAGAAPTSPRARWRRRAPRRRPRPRSASPRRARPPGRRTGQAAPPRSSSQPGSGPGPDERAARTARRAARRFACPAAGRAPRSRTARRPGGRGPARSRCARRPSRAWLSAPRPVPSDALADRGIAAQPGRTQAEAQGHTARSDIARRAGARRPCGRSALEAVAHARLGEQVAGP